MSTDTLATVDTKPELVRTLHLIYALHALGLVLGAFGAASVIGSTCFRAATTNNTALYLVNPNRPANCQISYQCGGSTVGAE